VTLNDIAGFVCGCLSKLVAFDLRRAIRIGAGRDAANLYSVKSKLTLVRA